MLVKDYMSNHAISIHQDSDYKSAFVIMDENNIHHLPVVNNSNEVVGIATYRELRLAARYLRESPVEISEVMHKPVLTVMATDTLLNAAKLMTDNKFGCLPILDENNRVAGMLTDTDLFRALLDLLVGHK